MIDMIIMMHDAAETIIKLPLFQLYIYDADILCIWVVMNRRRWDTLFLLTKIRKCLRSFIKKLRIYFVYFINPYYGDMMDNIFYYYYLLF